MAVVGRRIRRGVAAARGYAGINAGSAVVTGVRGSLLACGTLRASTALHDAALFGVLRAPTAYFASTSVGRIVSRFSSDVSMIDNTLRYNIASLAAQASTLVATLVVTAWVTPFVLPLVGALALGYAVLANAYRVSARDLRRLQSVARSSLLSFFVSALQGREVILGWGPAAVNNFSQRQIELCRPYVRAAAAYAASNEFISLAYPCNSRPVSCGWCVPCPAWRWTRLVWSGCPSWPRWRGRR